MTSNPTIDSSSTLRTLEFSIHDMTCASCAARIEERLNDLDRVSATVNYATHKAVVEAPSDVSVNLLLGEVEKAGYRAEEIRNSDPLSDTSTSDDYRVRYIGRRLIVAALLFMPLCDASLAFSLVPRFRFPFWQWLLVFLTAPVVVWAASPIHSAALRAARHRTSTMDTLVSMGIIASTSWSLYAMFFRDHSEKTQSVLTLLLRQSNGAIYLDVAAGVTTFLLAGRYYEALSKRRTGNVLRSLSSVGAKDASVLLGDGTEQRIPVARLRLGDRFVVRPGEKVATDGRVVSGRAGIDRSMLTGESRPAEVTEEDRVVGGTIALTGRLVVEATEVGDRTQLALMVKLVEAAQNEKASVQRLADRIARVFVPTVVVLSVITFLGWLFVSGSTERAFSTALAVLIIACPCALGLATPTALFVATGRAAQMGIFIKGYQALEASRVIDTVVLDKTGTVTEGTMTVTGIELTPGITKETLLKYAAAVEQASEHAIAAAVVEAAHRQGETPARVEGFRSLPGLGALGRVEGHQVIIGNARLLAERGVVTAPSLASWCSGRERGGHSTVLVSVDNQVIGALAVSDVIKPSAPRAAEQLRGLGLELILMSGDNESTTRTVGRAIGVDHVIAGMLPEDKLALIRELQDKGRSVAVVGDGVNDAPALVASDLGLAIGSGTDVAINAADMVLVRDSLVAAPVAIGIARTALHTIRVNLAWAFVYNLAAIPLAALGFLNPLLAAGSMALSSTFVVWNSSRLRHFGEPQSPTVAPKRPQGGVNP